MRAPPYVIAEMACSHDGRVDLGKRIIDGAAAAGANAIQFQIWRLSHFMVPHHPAYEQISKIELSREQWSELAGYVRARTDMEIIACVNEHDSIDFAGVMGADAFKIHASDLSNPEIIEHVARIGARIDLSVGAASIQEIADAVEWIRSRGNADIWLMYGLQGFPTPVDQVNLRYMQSLQEFFGLTVGYQDHTDPGIPAAFWLPAAALGLGISVLEKHITHDRSRKGFDHEAALDPDEFSEFVRMVTTVDAALGVATPRPFNDEELKYRRYARKSLVARRRLEPGHVLGPDDLLAMRTPEPGLPPHRKERVLGRPLKRALSAYEHVDEDSVQ